MPATDQLDSQLDSQFDSQRDSQLDSQLDRDRTRPPTAGSISTTRFVALTSVAFLITLAFLTIGCTTSRAPGRATATPADDAIQLSRAAADATGFEAIALEADCARDVAARRPTGDPEPAIALAYDCADPDDVIAELTRVRDISLTCIERAAPAPSSDLVAAHLIGGPPGAHHRGPFDGPLSASACVLMSSSAYDAWVAIADQTREQSGVAASCLADFVHGLSDADLAIAIADSDDLSRPDRSDLASCADPHVTARRIADNLAEVYHEPPDVDCVADMLTRERLEEMYRRTDGVGEEITERCYDIDRLTAVLVASLPPGIEVDDACLSGALSRADATLLDLAHGPMSAEFYRELWACFAIDQFVELVIATAVEAGADVTAVDRECIARVAAAEDLGPASERARSLPHHKFRACGVHLPG